MDIQTIFQIQIMSDSDRLVENQTPPRHRIPSVRDLLPIPELIYNPQKE